MFDIHVYSLLIQLRYCWLNEWKSFYKLAPTKKGFISQVEYNCFDSFFQVLFVNITVRILFWIIAPLVLWIFLWILYTLQYWDSQVLNEKLKLMGGGMTFFQKFFFKVICLKTFWKKMSNDWHIRTWRSLKWKAVSRVPGTSFRRTNFLLLALK